MTPPNASPSLSRGDAAAETILFLAFAALAGLTVYAGRRVEAPFLAYGAGALVFASLSAWRWPVARDQWSADAAELRWEGEKFLRPGRVWECRIDAAREIGGARAELRLVVPSPEGGRLETAEAVPVETREEPLEGGRRRLVFRVQVPWTAEDTDVRRGRRWILRVEGDGRFRTEFLVPVRADGGN